VQYRGRRSRTAQLLFCHKVQRVVETRGVLTLFFFLTLHPILFGKFCIRIQSDSTTTMMQVIQLLFDSASIKGMHIPHNID